MVLLQATAAALIISIIPPPNATPTREAEEVIRMGPLTAKECLTQMLDIEHGRVKLSFGDAIAPGESLKVECVPFPQKK